jgi:putative transposase
MRNIEPVVEGNYYHIFNRGIDGEAIFRENNNYIYFLKKFEEYIGEVADTLAYSLLRDHFHILVFVKRDVMVRRADQQGDIKLDFSKQLGHFLNGYAQTFNKKYHRAGSLFESPFRRKMIVEDLYLGSVMFYIHANAQHHGLVKDFRSWPFSSYPSLAEGKSTFVKSRWIFDWFGGTENFIRFHRANYKLMVGKNWVLEKDKA